ncbi:ATP-binding cassette sub-family G member 1 [Armadillidium nasatum]|uniref:ATP-binding cassette sub-family G member 1 n=1 Tax=Armadillidium nasatum TaxID=96803 RepID=A0A5N5TDG2_9CRUS|nr:ATP-binding cassette sub-family G member 1 [Armadillidium nasatum]
MEDQGENQGQGFDQNSGLDEIQLLEDPRAQEALQVAQPLVNQSDIQGEPSTVLRVTVEHMIHEVTHEKLDERNKIIMYSDIDSNIFGDLILNEVITWW